MSIGRKLGLRLFLEGIELEVSSATVTAGINNSAQASIRIPSSDSVHRLLPRTLVHLFYLDSSYHFEGYGPASASSPPVKIDEDGHYVDAARRATDMDDPRHWRLLFAGEVIGYGYQKAGGVRNIILQCQDFSSYWSAAKLYWGKSKTSLQGYKRAIFAGATRIYRRSRKNESPSNDLINLLRSKPSTLPKLPGLLGGIVSVLESVTGVYETKLNKNFRGVNDFISQSEIRLHLTRMIGASPDDTTSSAFIKASAFKRYIRRLTSQVKGTASFMDLTGLLLQRIYHDWCSVAAPPYMTTNQLVTRTIYIPKGTTWKGDAKLKDIWNSTRDISALMDKTNDQSLAKSDLPAEVDNVMNVKSGETHKLDPQNKDTAGAPETTKFIGLGITAVADSYTDPPNASANQKKSNSDIGVGLAAAAKAQTLLKDFVKEDGNKKLTNFTKQKLQEIRTNLTVATEKLSKGSGTTYKKVVKNMNLNDRLNMFLFRPNIYMCPPPKCNVLFPDHYTSVSFMRKTVGELSRLWLHGRSAGGRNLKKMYFSPNTDILGGPSADDTAKALKGGKSFLMAHERYQGIYPMIEGIGDNDIFSKLNKKAKKEVKKAGGNEQEIAGQAAGSPDEHMQRAANYLFFQKRYRTRSMRIDAKFCPQVITGLPMLVLDPVKGPDSEGTHYLGMVESVTHKIDAEGGAATAISLSYCRSHTEGVDLFEEGKSEVTIQKTKVSKYKKKAKGTFSAKAEQGSLGHYSPSQDPGDVTGFDAPSGANLDVVVKMDEDSTLPGKATTVDVTSPGEKFSHKEVEVDVWEVKTKKSKTSVTFSFETTATPPWFSPIYRASQIGGSYYTPMLGCGSIMDDPPLDIPTQGTGAIKLEDNQGNPVKDHYERDGSEADMRAYLTGIGLNPDDFTYGGNKETMEGPWEAHTTARMKGAKADSSTTASVGVESPISGEVKNIYVPLSLTSPASTVADVAGQLSKVWLLLKETGSDMDLFLDGYTKRSYASLLDIFGNQNPYLKIKLRSDSSVPLVYTENSGEVLTGFHGNAFGELEDMKGPNGESLVGSDTPLVQAGGYGKERKLHTDVDPRKERYIRVTAYMKEMANRAQRG